MTSIYLLFQLFAKTTQDFEYNALTREIKQDGLCIDYQFSLNVLFMHSCHGGSNQKWYFDVSTNRLRTGHNEKCLNWNGVKLTMTPCSNDLGNQFQIPMHWLEAIGTSSFDEVRVFSDFNKCLELDTVSGKALTLKSCNAAEGNQKIYYDAENLKLRLWQTGFCVDYDFGSSNHFVRMHGCNGGLHQKWYHDRSTNQMRTLISDMCLDWGNSVLYMHTCHNGDNQKFLVSSLWYGHRSNVIRVLSNFTHCIVYDPDQSNNVVARECTKDGGLYNFEYDPFKKNIKQRGLCLDLISKDDSRAKLGNLILSGNVIMWPCNENSSQQWTYDNVSYQIMSNSNTCLELEDDGNIGGKTCTRETYKQRFFVPESWTIAKQAAPMKVYHGQHVTPSIWSSDVCLVDSMKDVIKTCDDSMSLLLGASTSIGTLQAIAKAVNDKGPERMPGTCCLDSPLTSQFYGHHVSDDIKVFFTARSSHLMLY